MTTTVSVPGKLILIGEHAAVYGRPALVAAVGLRLRVTVQPGRRGGDSKVRMRLSDFGTETEQSWSEILERARRAREAWERYDRDPGPATFAALAAESPEAPESGAGGDSLALVELALGEAARELGEDDPERIEPLDLTVTSEVPVGCGFGSSAAAAVGVVMAYLAFRGADLDPRRLHRVSLEVERRQHGSPSGVDNATVLYGGILQARRLASGEVAFEEVAVRPRRLDRLRVVDTGRPAEPTGAVVAAVRVLRDREPARVEAVLDRLGELTLRLRRELGRSAEEPAEPPDQRSAGTPRERPEEAVAERREEGPDELVAILREAEAGLEELGVVPAPVRELVRRVEAEGGAAKVSGAGSLAGPGAGNLIVYHPEPERIERWGFLAGRRRQALELGVPGARIEAPEEAASADGGVERALLAGGSIEEGTS